MSKRGRVLAKLGDAAMSFPSPPLWLEGGRSAAPNYKDESFTGFGYITLLGSISFSDSVSYCRNAYKYS
jgi:hypothetical protein